MEIKFHTVPTDSVQGLINPILLTWRIWWAPNNASKWQMGFNSTFKGLSNLIKWQHGYCLVQHFSLVINLVTWLWGNVQHLAKKSCRPICLFSGSHQIEKRYSLVNFFFFFFLRKIEENIRLCANRITLQTVAAEKADINGTFISTIGNNENVVSLYRRNMNALQLFLFSLQYIYVFLVTKSAPYDSPESYFQGHSVFSTSIINFSVCLGLIVNMKHIIWSKRNIIVLC